MGNMPNTGVIVVDATAAVVFVNKVAERLLGCDKIRAGLEGICAGDPIANRRLRTLIAACTNQASSHGTTGGTVELHGSERHPCLRIEISPFADNRTVLGPNSRRAPLALLLVSDPQQAWLDRAAELQQRFSLTPAEGKFALEIIRGDGRAAAAARLNITIGTAHVHLTRIFEKTGVRRQAALVRLLLSGA
jgi:DNA-binding CsgD family transcriptional regulator